MNFRKPMILAAAALFAAGCGSDGGGPDTVTGIAAAEIAQNTADDAAPIQLNDLLVSDRDTREDTDPMPVN